jgi:hypothetical protein
MEWSEMHESTLPDEDAFTPCLNMILNRQQTRPAHIAMLDIS